MKITNITKIKKIENNSKRYDIQTESNNFFANNILVHNSIISIYWNDNQWNVATRSMAHAEGTIPMGLTFRQVFDKAAAKTHVWGALNQCQSNKTITWVFELTSPETRVVTPYKEASLTLIGARENLTGRELTGDYLDAEAVIMQVRRPKSYKFTTIEETIDAANKLNAMAEGFVLVNEQVGSHFRLKCKNSKYLAIAHLRSNGGLSAKRVLHLVVSNEQSEYLQYFEEDKPYFSFVENIWKNITDDVTTLHNKYNNLVSQKDFALAIIPLCKNDWEKGVLFEMRKRNIALSEVVKGMDAQACNKLAKAINLRGKLSKQFGVIVEEDT